MTLWKLLSIHQQKYEMKTRFNIFSKIWLVFCYFLSKKPKFGTSILTELVSIQLAVLPKLLFSHYLKKPKPHEQNNFQITKFTTVALYVVGTSNWRIPVAIFWTVSSLFFHADDSHSCILWIFTPNSVHWQISIIPYGFQSTYGLPIAATGFGYAKY